MDAYWLATLFALTWLFVDVWPDSATTPVPPSHEPRVELVEEAVSGVATETICRMPAEFEVIGVPPLERPAAEPKAEPIGVMPVEVEILPIMPAELEFFDRMPWEGNRIWVYEGAIPRAPRQPGAIFSGQ